MPFSDISEAIFHDMHNDFDNDDEEVLDTDIDSDDDENNIDESTLDVQTDTEDKVVEPEFEEFEVPDYIPDDLIPPEKFESDKEELEWYKDNYVKSMELTRDPKFLDFVLNTYKEELDKLEKESVDRILSTGNIAELKIKYPQLLGKAGVDATFSEDDKINVIDNHLKATFGVNYKDKFDETEANDPNTISGKMLA